jgi:hypothetical protein
MSPQTSNTDLYSKSGQLRSQQQGISRLATLLILVVLCGSAGIALAARQSIYDWARLHNYQAPAAVSTISDQDTMTPYARKLFYINHPLISEKDAFRSECPANGGEQTIVLGCYRGDQGGIYLLNVTDERLDGVKRVTAAHEMLHAAYDRLSSSDRKNVDKMLTDYFQRDMHDPRLAKTFAAYQKSEPNDVVNEMHSIFGTEVANLPPGLETYYQRYFTDRSQVAGFAAQYQSVFTQRQDEVVKDDAQLASLKAQIEADQSDLKSKQQQLDELRNGLVAARARGDIPTYNAGVPRYNGLIDSYNAEVASVKTMVAQYNQLVEQRNALALEVDKLVDDLNANVSPINQ